MLKGLKAEEEDVVATVEDPKEEKEAVVMTMIAMNRTVMNTSTIAMSMRVMKVGEEKKEEEETEAVAAEEGKMVRMVEEVRVAKVVMIMVVVVEVEKVEPVVMIVIPDEEKDPAVKGVPQEAVLEVRVGKMVVLKEDVAAAVGIGVEVEVEVEEEEEEAAVVVEVEVEVMVEEEEELVVGKMDGVIV